MIKRKLKTPKKIKQELRALKLFRAELDNIDWLEVLDAQIFVLKNNLSKEQILDEFEYSETPERVLSLAFYARDWLDGVADSMTLLREIGYYQNLIDFDNELRDDYSEATLAEIEDETEDEIEQETEFDSERHRHD